MTGPHCPSLQVEVGTVGAPVRPGLQVAEHLCPLAVMLPHDHEPLLTGAGLPKHTKRHPQAIWGSDSGFQIWGAYRQLFSSTMRTCQSEGEYSNRNAKRCGGSIHTSCALKAAALLGNDLYADVVTWHTLSIDWPPLPIGAS